MMTNFQTIRLLLCDWYIYLINVVKVKLRSRAALEIEIIALRSQLVLYQQQELNHLISKLCSNWKSFLVIVKPETVIGWHRTAFRFYWARKSKHAGGQEYPMPQLLLIKRIHKENLLWSPERIHNQLVYLGITDTPAPNTIAKYLQSTRKPPNEKIQQSWKTFLANHRQDIWSMDFLTVPTVFFKVLLDYIIPFNEAHLQSLLGEYIHRYYNPSQTHQGIKRQIPVLSQESAKTSIAETSLISDPLLGGLYHNYRKVA